MRQPIGSNGVARSINGHNEGGISGLGNVLQLGFQGFQTMAATSSVHAGEFMTIGGGVEGGQQGGTTPIYQNGAPHGDWQDVSYNVAGSSSTSERRV